MAITKERIASALSGLSAEASEQILGAITHRDFEGRLDAGLAADADALLPLAAIFSRAPISGYHVGAIAVGQSGQIYLGANLEFEGVSLNATLHAEQSAVVNAWIHGESAIKALHISAPPCGHCRQFLRELSNTESLDICIQGRVDSINQLLPDAFGDTPAKGHGLMDGSPYALQATQAETDPARIRAIEAAQQSYAPYSHSPEGFVIKCIDGQTFTGRSAESVAFNPSISATLVALNQRNLSASRDAAITTCTLAKLETTSNNPLPLAESLLKALTDVTIDVVQMKS